MSGWGVLITRRLPAVRGLHFLLNNPGRWHSAFQTLPAKRDSLSLRVPLATLCSLPTSLVKSPAMLQTVVCTVNSCLLDGWDATVVANILPELWYRTHPVSLVGQ